MGVSLHWQKADKRGLGYLKARADGLSGQGAGKNFKKLDKDSDGYLTEEELREEFAETYAHWAATTKAAIDETPKKYRKFQLEDMEGDFNIEDLPSQQMAALAKATFELEAKAAIKQEL